MDTRINLASLGSGYDEVETYVPISDGGISGRDGNGFVILGPAPAGRGDPSIHMWTAPPLQRLLRDVLIACIHMSGL